MLEKNLYFQRSNGKYLLIKENVLEKEVLEEISNFLKRHNYTSYYTRFWHKGEQTIYDVGSWSEYFVLAPQGCLSNADIVGTENDFVDKANNA